MNEKEAIRKAIYDIPVMLREAALLTMAEVVLEELPKAHEELENFKAEMIERLLEIVHKERGY